MLNVLKSFKLLPPSHNRTPVIPISTSGNRNQYTRLICETLTTQKKKKLPNRTQFGIEKEIHKNSKIIIKIDIIAHFHKHLSFNINALRDIRRFNFQFVLLRIYTTEEF
jgi:hypothetical protein